MVDNTAPQGILTPLQERVLQGFFADEWFRRHFYLTGGTALAAYYFQHRLSEDLDFFSHGIELTPAPLLVERVAQTLQVTAERVRTSPSFMRYTLAGELQIDIVVDVDYRVGTPVLIGNNMVDTIHNMSVNKVCAILGRFDPKDYVDLYWIAREQPFDIFSLFRLAVNKDAGVDPFVWASLIADAEKIELLPRMVKPLELTALKQFYRELRARIVDQLKPIAR